MSPQENSVPVAFRSHTILGVCEAIGEDFGFNPVLLRIPFAASVLISPTWAIGSYFVLGAVVLLSRLVFPKQTVSAALAEEQAPLEPVNSDEPKLPLAA